MSGLVKNRTIYAKQEVAQLIETVSRSAERALDQFLKRGAEVEGLHALWTMKFVPIGCDPLNAESPLNLIEQLNQTFTYLASARAVEVLFDLYPEFAPFTLHLGTAAGSDIESTVGAGLAAEVFAAVNTSNNKKLAKDIAKVGRTAAGLKFVFFMCPGYELARQLKHERDGVQVWSVRGAL